MIDKLRLGNVCMTTKTKKNYLLLISKNDKECMQKKECMVQKAMQTDHLYNNHNHRHQNHHQLQRSIIRRSGSQYRNKQQRRRQRRRTRQHYQHPSFTMPMATLLLPMETILPSTHIRMKSNTRTIPNQCTPFCIEG